jgi:hypothetical protein
MSNMYICIKRYKGDEEMGMTYAEFKETVKKREIQGFDEYGKIIADLNNIYNEAEDFIFFYPKNLWNGNKTELIFFLKDGYLTVEKEKNSYQYNHFNCKLLSKSLTKGNYKHNEHILKLNFDNGREFFFSNALDANEYWLEHYTESIIDLYKTI